MAYPQIVYDPGTGAVILPFTFPPVKKPGADMYAAERADSVAYSGQKQSLLQRVDTFRLLQMDFVPMEDMPAWSSFVFWAVGGGQFKYFVDSDQPDYETFTLEDSSWSPKFSMVGIAGFTLKLRKAVV